MIIIAAGSSLPFCGIDSQQIVLHSFLALGRIMQVKACSPLYDSPAWPEPTDPRFVNAVAQVETSLSPKALLAALHSIETAFGRERARKNSPRTLDLDLIDYDGRQISNGVILPHPSAHLRDFVLAPLADIAPDWRHPVTGKSAASLLAGLPKREARPIQA